MGLLADIQMSLLDEKTNLASILLKMRFLASRLGSGDLEGWVQHETEGYPPEVPVPAYRTFQVAYFCTLQSYQGIYRNVGIPPAAIEEHIGKEFNEFGVRQGLAELNDLIVNCGETRHLNINRANLVILLQDKVFRTVVF